ncbi:MAG: flagellar hook-length control protein FliK [Parvularculaceae bacterium]
MTESAIIAVQPSPAPQRRTDSGDPADAPGFSYALAAASLERNAAKSLEAHGARPERQASAGETQANESVTQPRDGGGRSQQPDAQAPQQKAAAQQTTAETASKAAPAISSPSASAPATATPVAAAGQTQSVAVQPKAVEAAAPRDAAGAKSKLIQTKAPRLAEAPPALKEAFAEILARRLEKTSVFDLRLDPPDLGRVEGRLAVNDDGKAVLSLTFDNQNAFDLFSRDEQALRAALHQAGLNFGAGDFTFSFREPAETQSAGADGRAPVITEASPAYEPAFAALWTAGAVDIRI